MVLITLTTDFGQTDSYVGIMKGIIAKICPQARWVDLTHAIPPQDIAAQWQGRVDRPGVCRRQPPLLRPAGDFAG